MAAFLVTYTYHTISGKCSTPSQLLFCSSFSRENGHLLLICSSLSTSHIYDLDLAEWHGFFAPFNQPKFPRDMLWLISGQQISQSQSLFKTSLKAVPSADSWTQPRWVPKNFTLLLAWIMINIPRVSYRIYTPKN